MAESPNVGWASFFAHHFTALREIFLENYVILVDEKVGKFCVVFGGQKSLPTLIGLPH